MQTECNSIYVVKCMEYMMMEYLAGNTSYHVDEWGTIIMHSDTDLIRLILYMGGEL